MDYELTFLFFFLLLSLGLVRFGFASFGSHCTPTEISWVFISWQLAEALGRKLLRNNSWSHRVEKKYPCMWKVWDGIESPSFGAIEFFFYLKKENSKHFGWLNRQNERKNIYCYIMWLIKIIEIKAPTKVLEIWENRRGDGWGIKRKWKSSWGDRREKVGLGREYGLVEIEKEEEWRG